MELFTRSGNLNNSFCLISGSLNGTLNSVLQVMAPTGLRHRVNEAIATENPREFMVVSESDSTNQSKFLLIARLDSSGVGWAKIHDHTTIAPEIEYANGLIRTSDANYMYSAYYRGEDATIQSRLIKMNGTGDIIWAREYFIDDEKLSLYTSYETSDSGYFITAISDELEAFFLIKLNVDGTVAWSQIHYFQSETVFPLGSYIGDNAGQLWGYNAVMITEMDDEGNVCNLSDFEGVTSVDVEPNVVEVNYTSSIVAPDFEPAGYINVQASFQNELQCVYTGVDDSDEPEFVVFPNPVRENLTADLSGISGKTTLEIYDLQGRSIIGLDVNGGAENIIDVSELKSGVYFIKCMQETLQGIRRFVKL